MSCSNCGQPNTWPELFHLFYSKQLAIFKIAVAGESDVRPLLFGLLKCFNVVQTGDRIFLEIYRYFLSIHFGGGPPILAIQLHLKTRVTNHISKINLVKPSAFIFPIFLSYLLIATAMHLEVVCNE